MNQRDHSGFLKLMGYSVKMYNMGTIMDIEQKLEWNNNLIEDLKLYMQNNYSYIFFSLMMDCVKLPEVDGIILGSSYGLHGIDLKRLSTQVNVSMTSQDLEYDLKLLQFVLNEKNKEIKKVVVILGGYALYDNMKKSRMGQYLIKHVYRPVLENIDTSWEGMSCTAMEKEKIRCAAKKKIIEEGNFFNSIYSREDNCESKYKGIIWQELSDEQRKVYAKDRVLAHNKLKNISLEDQKENVKYLNEMARLCNVWEIEFYVIIPPFTSEYNALTDKSMKEELLKTLENMPYAVNYYDLNSEEWRGCFLTEDFFDMDHLNDGGAVKFTEFIKKVFD